MVTASSVSRGRNFSHLGQGLTVLVEEEESIRESWTIFFSQRKLRLQVYDSAEAFLSNFQQKDEHVEFFFDQDFGKKRGVGLHLACAVRNWPRRTGTSLVTSYFPEEFEPELIAGIIDAVLPKFPDGIFGERFFDRHMERRIQEQGLKAVMVESMTRMGEAVQDLNAVTTQAQG